MKKEPLTISPAIRLKSPIFTGNESNFVQLISKIKPESCVKRAERSREDELNALILKELNNKNSNALVKHSLLKMQSGEAISLLKHLENASLTAKYRTWSGILFRRRFDLDLEASKERSPVKY